MYRILRCTCALQRLSHKQSVTSPQHLNSGGGELIYALSSLQLFLPGVLWLYFLKLLLLRTGPKTGSTVISKGETFAYFTLKVPLPWMVTFYDINKKHSCIYLHDKLQLLSNYRNT